MEAGDSTWTAPDGRNREEPANDAQPLTTMVADNDTMVTTGPTTPLDATTNTSANDSDLVEDEPPFDTTTATFVQCNIQGFTSHKA